MAEVARKTYKNPPEPTREDYLAEHGLSEKEAVDRMSALGATLERIAQDTVGQRQPIEKRWLDDLKQYNGEMLPQDKGKTDENRSSITVKITRARTNTGEARLFDMLFPTDDKNWGVRTSPIPALPPGMNEDDPLADDSGKPLRDPATGEPVRASDMRSAEMAIAHDRAKAMERRIDDQLTESLYSSIARDVLHDACLWGSGILKGPIVEESTQRVWVPKIDQQGRENWILSFVQNFTPVVARTDPWNFFPEIGPLRVSDCEHILERHLLNKRQVHKLARQPGFIASQIRKVLESEPNFDVSGEYHEMLRISGMQPSIDNRYVFWEYHGLLDKADLVAINPKLLLNAKDIENPLELYEGVVWFCNGIVVKAIIEPLDTGEFPYSVFNWEKDDSSILGFGIPYVMRNTQRVIDASWRMTMDNAGLSAGPQIVVNSGLIKPADGHWNVHARKIWIAENDKADISKAFSTFEVSSHISELMTIFNTAMGLVDEETNMPLIVRGSSTTDVSKTAGGMALLQNNANVILRRQVKNWDDDATTPLIRRFCDWNMQYSNDNSIKGDMKPDARGSSVLLVREIEAQNIVAGMQFLDHPILGKFHKPYPLLRRAWKAMQVDPQEVLVGEDEAERIVKSIQEGSNVPPEVQAAQIEAQTKEKELALKQQQIEAENYRAELQQQTKLAELAQKSELTIEQLRTQFGIAKLKDKTERDKTVIERQVGDPYI